MAKPTPLPNENGFASQWNIGLKVLKLGNKGSQKKMNISENQFFYFYFLNVHISLSMEFQILKFCISIANIAVEGKVSQILYIGPHSFFYKM